MFYHQMQYTLRKQKTFPSEFGLGLYWNCLMDSVPHIAEAGNSIPSSRSEDLRTTWKVRRPWAQDSTLRGKAAHVIAPSTRSLVLLWNVPHGFLPVSPLLFPAIRKEAFIVLILRPGKVLGTQRQVSYLISWAQNPVLFTLTRWSLDPLSGVALREQRVPWVGSGRATGRTELSYF